MKLRASAEVEYDCEEVLGDLRKEYPDKEWTMKDAEDTVRNWIRDDFSSCYMEYKVEEIYGKEEQ